MDPQTIRAVGDALAAGAEIAAPRVDSIRGHPVGFSTAFRESLLALTGDAGAGRIVAANSHQLTTIDCDDRGILADIDTPADISR
ncbi:NTP transferase domain-containing protein [Aromatoleum anaerobium]|uniref:NTP transferase domain-containing protein n=1 Tax=Aromatoleum anaerobium TaxID=182180 RepID=UPI003CCFF3D6